MPGPVLRVLLAATPVLAVLLSLTDLRFGVAAAVTSVLAGRRGGGDARALAGFVAALVVGAAVVVSVRPAMGTEAVGLVVFAALVPWLIGLAWRQSAALVRAGWDRAEHLEREQRHAAERACSAGWT